MNLKLIALGIVAMLLVAGVVFIYLPSEDDGGDTGMTATIVIEELDTGQKVEAEVDLSDPTWTEQMMLSFGGIRDTEFKPLYSTDPGGDPGLINGPIRAAGKYAIYLKGTVRIDGTDLSSSSVSMKLDLTGTVAKPSAGLMSSSGTVAGQHVYITKTILVNTAYDFDQSTEGAKFAFVGSGALLGASLDGAKLTISMTATGTDGTQTVTSTATATILLTVGSWTTATIEASIISIHPGVPVSV